MCLSYKPVWWAPWHLWRLQGWCAASCPRFPPQQLGWRAGKAAAAAGRRCAESPSAGPVAQLKGLLIDAGVDFTVTDLKGACTRPTHQFQALRRSSVRIMALMHRLYSFLVKYIFGAGWRGEASTPVEFPSKAVVARQFTLGGWGVLTHRRGINAAEASAQLCRP